MPRNGLDVRRRALPGESESRGSTFRSQIARAHREVGERSAVRREGGDASRTGGLGDVSCLGSPPSAGSGVFRRTRSRLARPRARAPTPAAPSGTSSAAGHAYRKPPSRRSRRPAVTRRGRPRGRARGVPHERDLLPSGDQRDSNPPRDRSSAVGLGLSDELQPTSGCRAFSGGVERDLLPSERTRTDCRRECARRTTRGRRLGPAQAPQHGHRRRDDGDDADPDRARRRLRRVAAPFTVARPNPPDSCNSIVTSLML